MKKTYVFFCIALSFIVAGCSNDTVSSVEESPNETVPQEAIPQETVLTRDDIKESSVKDNRDGETYRTVKIGEQWWMAENLRYAADSSLCYNDEDYFCETYGRLYPWVTAMNIDTIYRNKGAIYNDIVDSLHQGVCPKDWHIPTKTEWEIMIEFVQTHNGTEGDGTSLRAPEMWAEYGEGESMVTHSDRFGFSVLPAGLHTDPTANHNANIYAEFTGHAFFWTSTEIKSFRSDVSKAYHVWFCGQWNDDAVQLKDDESKRNAMSIRCIKN